MSLNIDFIKESIRIIRQAIFDRKLVVFVGAGASINSGIPSWQGLISEFKEKLSLDEKQQDDFLKIPQYYYNSRGAKEYTEFVKDVLKYDDKEPNDIHSLILQLNPAHIITTNYDNFLERVAQKNGEFFEIIEQNRDIPYAKNGKMIIKMHGGFLHNNFVLKEDDYLNYSEKFAIVETYIKALIAQNIILFIGYSFNDPNTKQIFNWVKNILGKHFQRAYLIESSTIYDQKIFEYYKNIGINILYASEINRNENIFGIYEKTKNFLSYIIEDKENVNDIIDVVYNELAHYNILNVVLYEYIHNIFKKYCNLSLDENYDLVFHNIQNDNEQSIGEIKKLFNLLNLMWTGQNINSGIKNKQYEKLKIIYEVFRKTIIKNVYIESEKICSFENKQIDEIYEYFNLCNYKKIEEVLASIDVYNKDVNIEQMLLAAQCLFELSKYQESYKLLKKISTICKENKKYALYCISEKNRIAVGVLCLDENINDEIRKIDLDFILINNAQAFKKENKFLRDIVDLNPIYKALLRTVNDQRDSKQYNYKLDSSKLKKLSLMSEELYSYLQKNHLLVARDTARLIFSLYIDSIFYAYNIKEQKIDPFFLEIYKSEITNSKEISKFSCLIIVRYITQGELARLLKRMKNILLDYEALVYLKMVLKNLTSEFSYKDESKALTILTLLSRAKITIEYFQDIVKIVLELIDKNVIHLVNYSEIQKFILYQNYITNKNLDGEYAKLILELLMKRYIKGLIREDLIQSASGLFATMCNIMKQKNIIIEKKLFESFITQCQNSELLIPLYSIAPDKIKIQRKLKSILNQEFNSELYTTLIIEKIIQPSIKNERKLIKEIKKIKKEQLDNPNSKKYPDPYKNILIFSINAFIANKILRYDDFRQYFMDNNITNFITNVNSFDYSKFDLEWMVLFSDKFIKKYIVNNKVAFQKISSLYKKEFEKENFDEDYLKIYFKYFDKN